MYTFLDIFIDIFYFFKNKKIVIKPLRVFIVLFSFLILLNIFNLILLYAFLKTFFLIIKMFLKILIKKECILSIPNCNLEYTYKSLFKIIKYNIDTIILNKIIFFLIFKKINKNLNINTLASSYWNLLTYLFWNYIYIFLVGKSFFIFLIIFDIIKNIILEFFDEIKEIKLKKKTIIRFKIYHKLFKKKLIWYGHQIFLKSYFSPYCYKNLLIRNHKILYW